MTYPPLTKTNELVIDQRLINQHETRETSFNRPVIRKSSKS